MVVVGKPCPLACAPQRSPRSLYSSRILVEKLKSSYYEIVQAKFKFCHFCFTDFCQNFNDLMPDSSTLTAADLDKYRHEAKNMKLERLNV